MGGGGFLLYILYILYRDARVEGWWMAMGFNG
jgi:hypothetical protein